VECARRAHPVGGTDQDVIFPVGIAPSIVGGSAWEPTPWRAVQRAALVTLVAGERDRVTDDAAGKSDEHTRR
jgi:hypothetical protein